jgi:hypothetical protein
MGKQTVETKFINWIASKNASLNKDKIRRKGGERKSHVRFSPGCGLRTEQEFFKLFDGLEYIPMTLNEFSNKRSYSTGGYVTWQNQKVGVLYGIAQQGNSERKRWSPDSLGLAGYETNNLKDFKNKILEGLRIINEKEISLFISLLNSVEHNHVVLTSKFLETNKSKITSDFGEVLAAYSDVAKGFKIKFGNKSNQKVFDYSVLVKNKWEEVSVKNPKGGGKVNLSDFADLIDITDVHSKILYALGTHNRDDFFTLTATVCLQVKKVSDIVGGLSKEDRLAYVKTHTYDEFYNQIKTDPLFVIKKQPLGVPDDQGWKPNELTPRALWAKGSLDPIDFTLNTFVNRFWGHSYVQEISSVVTKFLNKAKFKVVDINNGYVYIKERKFSDVKQWQTVYWSRATKAWHNWMAVEPTKETK